ncbi:MAG: ATPase involved in chromosome partitioning [Acidimicrobiales bacterium]|nr:ATPase involved in chromosome partitioning [Acidimicrobiales bacterium]
MLVSCWSVKGGVGTTVVAAALALTLARDGPGRRSAGLHGNGHGALLADLAGDLGATLGVAEPEGPGLAGWLAAGDDVPADALARLEQPVAPGLGLLPRGSGGLRPQRAQALAGLLSAEDRTVVVDCGRLGGPGAAAVIAAASQRSLLVTRACYLGLRRVGAAPVDASGVVLVREVGRSLGPRDVEDAAGAPVVAELALDPAVARAVDAGLLATRLPRSFERTLRSLA